jgi:organic radical activating enzyme
MENDSLKVSEQFYSIQGEGPTAGHPAYFLRLTACNLICDGSWTCDTINVWKRGIRKTFEEIDREFGGEMYYDNLRRGFKIVITGGEPLLQMAAVDDYIYYLIQRCKLPVAAEIETNGTIIPSETLLRLKHLQWNVSPKLSNSGMPYEKRFNKDAILAFGRTAINAIFKFVVKNPEDIMEIEEDYKIIVKNFPNKLYLMPACETRKELEQNSFWVVEVCKNMGWRYCNRLQIAIYDKTVGV